MITQLHTHAQGTARGLGLRPLRRAHPARLPPGRGPLF